MSKTPRKQFVALLQAVDRCAANDVGEFMGAPDDPPNAGIAEAAAEAALEAGGMDRLKQAIYDAYCDIGQSADRIYQRRLYEQREETAQPEEE